ncbi:ABC transporter permease [Agrococcus casei]|uniref:ABC transporter permease n=1 Tax=Agrococcus casei TaxID=343512 RepID=UPI003F8E7400
MHEHLVSLPLRPVGRTSKGVANFLKAIRELYERRELLGLLVRREIKARYKDSALGFVWGLIRPLTQLLVYYLVLGQFLGAARSIDQFAIYIFAGLTIYGFAAETITVMTGSIVNNSGLVKKVYLPREIFPIASIGSAGFNFGLQMIVLIIAAAIMGTLSFGLNLVFILAAVVLVAVFCAAIGLALSALNVYLRDMQYLVEVIVMLMMWASPIVYSWLFVRDAITNIGLSPWVLEIFVNNPLTLAVLGFQAGFWAPGVEGAIFPGYLMLRMLIAIVFGLILLFLAQRLFARLQGNFAQEL